MNDPKKNTTSQIRESLFREAALNRYRNMLEIDTPPQLQPWKPNLPIVAALITFTIIVSWIIA